MATRLHEALNDCFLLVRICARLAQTKTLGEALHLLPIARGVEIM
jgi:hypothetical protein